MSITRRVIFLSLFAIVGCGLGVAAAVPTESSAVPSTNNLVMNADFTAHSAGGPTAYELAGDLHYRDLADHTAGTAGWGVAFDSAKDGNHDGSIGGSVTQQVAGINATAGRWFRFSFRSLPEQGFQTAKDGLWMKVDYLTGDGKTTADGKAKHLDDLLLQERHDLSSNGDHRVNGAATWHTYAMDFWLPFPTIDALRLTVGFDHGSGSGPGSEFLLTDFSLTRIDGPVSGKELVSALTAPHPQGDLLPIGGRWFYHPKTGETTVPALFTAENADRLLYHDDQWTAPFVGSMTSWLRAGDKDLTGTIALQDQFIPDNVTVSFDSTSMIIHTRGLPNHPTGQFPETNAGPDGRGRGNPNYITEQHATYYIPLDPTPNPRHQITTINNSNHALPMGPIGIAANGVVFFNPFDAGSMDASNMMDICCGHPNQDGLYHYHKYPVCMNSPWADEGKNHSPLIGWAFDGYPIYGPYESAGIMAKDVTGADALSGFNMHYDKDRGWHYHVTPGKFPYIIGGYWGTEEKRDDQHPHGPGGPGGRGGRGGPGGGGPGGGFGGGGPPGPPDGPGFDGPPGG
jgi:YHYH protein